MSDGSPRDSSVPCSVTAPWFPALASSQAHNCHRPGETGIAVELAPVSIQAVPQAYSQGPPSRGLCRRPPSPADATRCPGARCEFRQIKVPTRHHRSNLSPFQSLLPCPNLWLHCSAPHLSACLPVHLSANIPSPGAHCPTPTLTTLKRFYTRCMA